MVARGRDRCPAHFDTVYPIGPAVRRGSIMAKARYSAAPQPRRADTVAPRYEAPIPPHLPRLRPLRPRRTSARRRRRIPVAPEVAAYRDRRQHSSGPCADDRPSDGLRARADARPCAKVQGRARSHASPPTSRITRARTRTPTRAQARSATGDAEANPAQSQRADDPPQRLAGPAPKSRIGRSPAVTLIDGDPHEHLQQDQVRYLW